MMTRQKKLWIIAAAVFVAYVIAGILLSLLLKPGSGAVWPLRIGFALLGIVSAGLILWFFRTPGDAVAVAGGDDITTVMTAAGARLTTAKGVARGASLRTRPAVILLGPRGSAKTSAVVRSGLEAELLAGDVFRGDSVAPTQGANVWYSLDTLFVEAGGDLIADASRWKRLARQIQPKRLKAAITGGTQAPRVAVVCISCEEFYKPNGGEELGKLARQLRDRLGELSQQLGIRLPVSVLFTKADTIPHFDSFLRNLSPDESREIVGASLSPDEGATGTYADRATPRIESAWARLTQSVAIARLRFLAREIDATRRLDAYEFPRELRKLMPLGVDFLRELCKPTQLGVSPILRGFYFTGVQAVIIPNVMRPELPAAQERVAAAGSSSATGVFSAMASAPQNAPMSPAAAPRDRKVPRWVGLPRFFHDVVLADAAAFRVAEGGTRLDLLRRGLLAAAIAAVLVLAIGLTTSFAKNRRLANDVRRATRSLAELPASDIDLASLATLSRLDSLRTWVDTLRSYKLDGAPMSMRWGLYNGNDLYPEARRAYFAGFDKVAFHSTRGAMIASMRALPDAPRPNDDYETTYNLLRAYLITTTNPKEASADFLRPVLTTYWLNGRRADDERQQLAQRQFDTYAAELRVAQPYSADADAAAIQRARTFLRQFSNSEHIYQYMLAEAAKTNPPIVFALRVPGAAGFVSAPTEVPGAFTKGGFAFMDNAFKNVDKFFGRDSWVLGDQSATATSGDQSKTVQDLRAHYATDYVDAWRRFLMNAQVARFGSVRDAAGKLAVLSGNSSPLLSLFFTASQNTAVSTPAIANAFQSVQTLVPPTTKDKLITEPNQAYMQALGALQASLEQVAGTPRGPAADAASGQAQSNAIAAKTASHQIAATFTLAADAQVNAAVQRLLDAPITSAEQLVKAAGASEINARAVSFCAVLRPMLAKFPFNPSSSTDATVAEVASMLRPGSGTLWTFYNDALQSVLQRQGTQFVSAPGASTRLSPSFVQTFSKLASFSEALFAADQAELRQRFTVQPLTVPGASSVTFTIDGQSARSTQNATETVTMFWPSTGRESKLAMQLGGAENVVAGPFMGTWGAFRLFQAADSWAPGPGGSGHRVEWNAAPRSGTGVGSGRVSVEVNVGLLAPMLRRGYFAGGSCSGAIAQ